MSTFSSLNRYPSEYVLKSRSKRAAEGAGTRGEMQEEMRDGEKSDTNICSRERRNGRSFVSLPHNFALIKPEICVAAGDTSFTII